MDSNEIIERVETAIEILFLNDSWLLRHESSEQSISHKLAEYLQVLFPHYNVDCEYNRNIEHIRGQKRIDFLKTELDQRGLLRTNEAENTDTEYADRQVYPDIIIHRRGTNKHNLCILEIKKSTSNVPRDYDEIKLIEYTGKRDRNDLNYQLGLFLEFATASKEQSYEMKIFENGERTG